MDLLLKEMSYDETTIHCRWRRTFCHGRAAWRVDRPDVAEFRVAANGLARCDVLICLVSPSRQRCGEWSRHFGPDMGHSRDGFSPSSVTPLSSLGMSNANTVVPYLDQAQYDVLHHRATVQQKAVLATFRQSMAPFRREGYGHLPEAAFRSEWNRVAAKIGP